MPNVEYWAEIPLESNQVRNGLIHDPAAAGQVISTAFRLRNLPRDRVVAAIPGIDSASRILLIRRDNGSLAQSVFREARRVFPQLEEGASLHWQALPPHGRQDQRVFALAVPQAAIRSMVETLAVAGIRPVSLDLKPLALYRAVPSKDAIIANLETTSLDIVIVAEDLPVFHRTSPIEGGSGIDQALDRLTDELSRAVRLYNDTNRQTPLPNTVPVFLSGDDIDQHGLIANIEALTGHPVEPLPPALSYPPDFPASRFLVNVGLVLKRL